MFQLLLISSANIPEIPLLVSPQESLYPLWQSPVLVTFRSKIWRGTFFDTRLCSPRTMPPLEFGFSLLHTVTAAMVFLLKGPVFLQGPQGYRTPCNDLNLYFPTCRLQGMNYAYVVQSSYLYFSSLSLICCICLTPPLFFLQTILCVPTPLWKTELFTSLSHIYFLNFLLGYLICRFPLLLSIASLHYLPFHVVDLL